MCVAYVLASLKVKKSKALIVFIICAKFIATFYLLITISCSIPSSLSCYPGLADGLMGLAVFMLWKEILRSNLKGGHMD